MSRNSREKPTSEFWNRAKEFVEWCTPEELRLLRIMAAKELEKRIKKWDDKLIMEDQKAKAAKSKAIKRNIKKA